ncbi:MAG TPA: glycosyltransferase family 4 protein [Candidatus Sumerlaeota bacterium]|nr:glycosyltransferase family 4 protein [Candidatus Sumerlaeota bacterium]HOR27606.1 glycosyltransferase family 4 protein [Candidatus Sumerlaeota bacterium]
MDRPLRIALANSGRRWIGEVAHVAMLYEQLERLGHEPWLICRADRPLHEQARERNWRILPLRFEHAFSVGADARDVLAWRRLVRERKIDLIHCHRGKDHWMGWVVARLTGRPLIRTRHVVMPVRRHPLNRWLYLHGTEAVLSVSRAAESGFGAWSEDLPRRRVVLAAVDADRFHPRRRSEEWRRRHVAAPWRAPDAGAPLWFGLIGRYQRVKGHDVFLEAAARVAARVPEAHFLIAGQGPPGQRAKRRRLAGQLGIADRVWIAGHLGNLAKVLASLDVGVIASRGSEGSSRIALEMMAAGLPLAATRVGGIPELVEPCGCARVVPADDPEALADAMLAWARDPAARQRAGEAGRRRVLARHTPRRWAEQMVQVYREVLLG